MERERVIQFLLGLNTEYDQACDRVLGKEPFPDLVEAFAHVRGDEGHKELMKTNNEGAGGTTPENSALAAARTQDNRKAVDKEKKWCDYCQKPRHKQCAGNYMGKHQT
ncbi:hypothetical protein PanWU01x14_025770 [Parasponia andersonii]|uniref:Uncharacterized protein n=1 Tax=Parasponia andersonii TaxID=3476 RepID=A0A2P5DX20_PARAD|nr:hypothetical protein PanWU01x14_025770 [Parasponia andersonii]